MKGNYRPIYAEALRCFSWYDCACALFNKWKYTAVRGFQFGVFWALLQGIITLHFRAQEKFLAKWHNLKLLLFSLPSISFKLWCGALEITRDEKWISYASKYNIPQLLMSFGLMAFEEQSKVASEWCNWTNTETSNTIWKWWYPESQWW